MRMPRAHMLGDEAVQRKAKLEAIRQALDADTIDLVLLRALAVSPYGFVAPEMRAAAWPVLLGLAPSDCALDYARMYQIDRFEDDNESYLLLLLFMTSSTQEYITSLTVRYSVRGPTAHRDHNQVEVDVARSLWRWPPGKSILL